MPEIVNVSHLSTDIDTQDNREVMVSVQNVSMMFNIASAQLNSLKEYAIAAVRRELAFKEFWALNDISFDVKRGDVYGIMGTNGSGKSTILKIIAGVLDPTKGKCKINGNIAPLIELGAGFDLELTARENIYLNGALLGYSRKFINQHFDEIVDFSEVKRFLDMPMKNYSSGMVARIAFAIATIMIPDILIVDEVLSVGDFMFRQKCERRIQELIRDYGVTVLIVSHDESQVRRLCNKAIWIEKGHTRMIGTAEEVCDIYRLVGGRTGSAESEKLILSSLEDRSINLDSVSVESIFGDTKYGTAVKMALHDGKPSDHIMICSGDDLSQCLIATGLASLSGAKMLTSPDTNMLDATKDAIAQLNPSEITFFGTPGAINPEVLSQELPYQPKEINSVQAVNITNLSIKAFEEGKRFGWGDTCVLSPEFCVGDLFAIMPAVTRLKAPIFFVGGSLGIEQELIDLICSNFKRVLVLAGESCIKSEYLKPFEKAGLKTQRFKADDEFGANTLILNWLKDEFKEEDWGKTENLTIVAPRTPEDAYCAGIFAASTDSLIVLSNSRDLDHAANAISLIQGFEGSVRNLNFVGDPSIFSEIDKEVLQRAAASAIANTSR